MKKFAKHRILAVVSVLATLFAASVANSACYWFVYQPEEPECLKGE